MEWRTFENNVSDIFRLFGYEVVQDTKVDSAQTDIIARSNNKFKPKILIECKYHDSDKQKVGIDEVENFRARILTLRMSGKIDQGYLVTNTGFTSSARESLADAANYVHLTHYNDLVYNLVDVDFYLKNYVQEYETKEKSNYIDLRVVDSSHLKKFDFTYSIMSELELLPKTYYVNYYIQFFDGNKLTVTTPRFGSNADNSLHKYKRSKSQIIRTLSQEYKKEILSVKQTEITNEQYKEIQKSHQEKFSSFTDYGNEFIKNQKQFCLIVGDFGSGKTTSIKHMMYTFCQKKLSAPNDPDIRIPLLLSLRNYNKVPDIDALLINFFTTELGYSNINIQVFKKLNIAGKFILILDGFDEMARLVTPIERRLTFIEICKLVTPNNKVLLTSRPGYFPDNKELGGLLNKYLGINQKSQLVCGINLPDNCQIGCLQLMNQKILKKYLDKVLKLDEDSIRNILKLGSISELARRPVLVNMIAETYNELKDLPKESITLKVLYDSYTNKWINREEDKGLFRILINSDEKMAFLGLLAIQMYEQDKLSLHFSDLDQFIQSHFKIDNQEKVDHFSHDIRTCSFLNREDNGYYFFIHKSFLEYFVAREFNNYSKNNFKGQFNKLFNTEILHFIDFSDSFLSEKFKGFNKIRELKNKVVKSQRFEEAAEIRDAEKKILTLIQSAWPKFENLIEVDKIVETLVNKIR